MSKDHIGNITEQIKSALASIKSSTSENLADKYIKELSEDYLIDYSADVIVSDIKIMEILDENNQYAICLGRSNKSEKKNFWQIKLFKLNDPVSLSRGLPIIENFGFKLLDEHPYKVSLSNNTTIHVCDFGVQVPEELAEKINDTVLANTVCDAIVAAFNREVENDAPLEPHLGDVAAGYDAAALCGIGLCRSAG